MDITSVGQVAGTTMLFRVSGRLHLAAILKASFQLQPGGSMITVDPEAIIAADEHRGGDPWKSLLQASDLVPYKPRADVILRGHARALGGRMVTRVATRLVVAQGQ